jgi:T5SS/PEP-CTERM-associated repeat protein
LLTGDITVADTGTAVMMVDGGLVRASQLRVGDLGNGTLNITNGGQATVVGVLDNEIAYGIGSVGVVTVDGAGSSLSYSGRLYVGYFGNGTLNVTGGAHASLDNLGDRTYVGLRSNATGTVLIDGLGSLLTTRRGMYIGYNGNGILNIRNKGQLINDTNEVSYIGRFAGSSGTVTIDGMSSTWSTSGGEIHVGEAGGGTLNVTNGGSVSALIVFVNAASSVQGDGNIFGYVQSNGLVSPGNSTGALHVFGGYAQGSTASLLIDLASSSSYDQMLVRDSILLNGTLTLNLLNGFVPAAGQTYSILTANSVTGTFNTVVLPTLTDVGFDILYNSTSVQLKTYILGDFDRNGIVDAADYVVWRKGLGTTYAQSDYDVWRAHFGQTVGSGSGISRNAEVPEPTSMVSLMLAAACVYNRRLLRDLECWLRLAHV